MKNGLHIDDHGEKFWWKDGKWHREDGPAVEYRDGSTFWYKDGLRHRLDGPAIEDYDGDTCWYKDDDWHREDGPAIEYYDGDKEWYIEDRLVYDDYNDNTSKFDLSDEMKKSIILYRLTT